MPYLALSSLRSHRTKPARYGLSSGSSSVVRDGWADQVDQDRDRLVLVRVSLLRQGPGQVKEQRGLACAWCSQDQHGVLELVEDGSDVLVVGDVLRCAVEWLDQQVVRANPCLGAFVDSECDAGAAGQ
jgi:hypothetical protein